MSTIKVDTYLTRGGASEIAIDKLKGASSAASISVVAEGGTNTTNLQQGLAKMFVSWVTDSGSPSSSDSFNVSTLNDGGAGDTQVVLSTVMSTSAGNSLVVGGNHFVSGNPVPDKIATNQVDYRNFNDSGSLEDGAGNNHSLLLHGDLA